MILLMIIKYLNKYLITKQIKINRFLINTYIQLSK